MRDRMERFVLLPFTIGCVSESSIGVVGSPYNKTPKESTPTRNQQEEDDEEECNEEELERNLSGENLKSPSNLSPFPRIQKLLKNVKSFSHFFVYKDEMDEPETEMQIGCPTDVKHVTHIGIDGSATSILSKSWDTQKTRDTFNIPSSPPTQLEAPVSPKIKINKLRVDNFSGK